MNEDIKSVKEALTKVELQVVPCANKVSHERQNVEIMNHESQDDPCIGKIILTVTCDGSKLTKADAGRFNEFQEEIWVTAKVTQSDRTKMPELDVNVHERCGAKLTKADAGRV